MEAPKPNGNPPRAVINGTPATAGGGGGGTTANGRPLPLPPSKAQYRAPYRPLPPPPRRQRRSRKRCCCLWFTLFIISLVFLAAIAAGVFYVLYHPQQPSFTVSSLRLSALNLASGDSLTSRIDLSVTARNPNRKVVFLYGDVAVAAYSRGVEIGNGTIPGFVHSTGNTTVIKVAVASSGWSLDPTEAADLRSRKAKYPLEIDFDTKAGVKIGSVKTKRIGIRASCGGIEVAIAKGNSTAVPLAVKCKVKLRIRIWNWTI